MKFLEKIAQRRNKANSIITVGLDPVMDQLPSRFQTSDDPFFEFNRWIIEQTNQYVVGYKLNSAFFEAVGDKGILSLKKTCAYLQTNYPDIAIIIDAKRGDIGHSNQQYAQFIFEYLQADAVTLQPYLGYQSLTPFFSYQEKGLIILCRTSNTGSGELQNLVIKDGKQELRLWQFIAQQVATTWQQQTKADLLLVFGATYPEELKVARKIAPKTMFLVPGIGKQGGDLQKSLSFSQGNLLITSSRSIIYAKQPSKAVKQLYQEIQSA